MNAELSRLCLSRIVILAVIAGACRHVPRQRHYRQQQLQQHKYIMATRCAFESSNEVGVFAALTNAYCLTGM
jgi:hypothetical protein